MRRAQSATVPPAAAVRLLLVALTAAAVGLRPVPAAAQVAAPPLWTSVGPPGSAVVDDAAFDPRHPAIAFVAMLYGGIARSTDGGRTWQSVNTGLRDAVVFGLTVHPQDGRWIYGYTQANQLVRSLDGGSTWSELAVPGTQVTAIAPAPTDPTIIYAGSDDGLFVSNRSGAGWRRVAGVGLPRFYSVTTVAVDPGNPRRLYAGIHSTADYGLFTSGDAGATWERRLRGIPSALLCDPQRPGFVYLLADSFVQRSRNQGATWEEYYPTRNAGALFFDPGNPRIAYVAAEPEVFGGTPAPLLRTTDDGGTWQPLSAGLPNVSSPIFAAAADGTLLFSGNYAGSLFLSTDRGDSWSQLDAFAAGLVNTAVTGLAFGPPGTLFAATSSGGGGSTGFSAVSRSADGGRTWTQVLTTADAFTALVADPADPQTLYAGAMLDDNSPALLYKTVDGGDTWAALPNPASEGGRYAGAEVADLAIDPGDSRIVYFALVDYSNGSDPGPGIYRSFDGGQTWGHLSLPYTYTRLATVPGTPGTLWAIGGDGGAYLSIDYGYTWTRKRAGTYISGAKNTLLGAIAIAPSNPVVIWLVGDQIAWRTTDGGDTWRRFSGFVQQNPDPYGLFTFITQRAAVDPTDPDTLYVATSNGLLRRSLGTRWQDLTGNLVNPALLTLAFDPADPTHLLLGTGGAGAFDTHLSP